MLFTPMLYCSKPRPRIGRGL